MLLNKNSLKTFLEFFLAELKRNRFKEKFINDFIVVIDKKKQIKLFFYFFFLQRFIFVVIFKTK